MTTHQLTADDHRFRQEFESGRLAPGDFDHRAHVRLAYTYLVGNSADAALTLLRSALVAYLSHHNVDPAKYHETMTRAWILAVRHFMTVTTQSAGADEFISRNPALLDSRIMLTHYSKDTLFSAEARAGFVEPDLDDIPRHESNTGGSPQTDAVSQ